MLALAGKAAADLPGAQQPAAGQAVPEALASELLVEQAGATLAPGQSRTRSG
jgi:hypothetical protein